MNNKRFAFTLIELVIVISLFFIMVTMTYIPYNHYLKKAKIRNSIREISQSLYEARNMAINGISSDSNVSVGVYFDTNSSNKLQFFSYPYSFSGTQITNVLGTDINLIKTYDLQPNINILDIDGKSNGLFFFEAITGKGLYYYWDASNIRRDIDISDGKISIDISYNGAPIGSPLASELIYYPSTNIVDY